jgi:formamidopyrimidine-DNA glycosylase
MPEGPEIRIYSEIVNELTKGKILRNINIYSNNNYKKINLKIINVDCKGKMLFLILENNIFIFITFGLFGNMSLIKNNKKNVRYELIFNSLNNIKLQENLLIDKGIKHTPINFINEILQIKDEVNTIYYVDQLNFGKIIIGDKQKLDKKIKLLGIDPLEKEITKKQFDNIINIGINKNKKIGLYEFLMKQNYLCGIGNYLSHEIMYHSGLSPHRKLINLKTEEKNKLFRIIIKIMKWSYISQGGKYKLYNKINIPCVPFKLMIYGKNKCKKGKIKIDKIIKGRTIKWCPEIQK